MKLYVKVIKETNPPTVLQYSRGILLYFYSGQAPTRLFVESDELVPKIGIYIKRR
jgi:hypothetical protein